MNILITSPNGKQEMVSHPDEHIIRIMGTIPTLSAKGMTVTVMPDDMEGKLQVELSYRIAKCIANYNRENETDN
jgi:hypothetical protein